MILECRFKVVTLDKLRDLVCLSDKRINEATSGKPLASRVRRVRSSQMFPNESIRVDGENLMAFAASPRYLVEYRSMTRDESMIMVDSAPAQDTISSESLVNAGSVPSIAGGGELPLQPEISGRLKAARTSIRLPNRSDKERFLTFRI